MTVLIDLDAASPPPSRPRPRWATARPAFLAALLVLAGCLGGAALPARVDGVTRVGEARAFTARLLTADALLTAHAEQVGSRIESAPLTPDGPRWTTPVTAGLPVLTLGGDGRTLMAQPREQEGRTTFIDARTGKVLWTAPQFAKIHLAGARVALWTWQEESLTGRLRMADLATGRTVWTRETDLIAMDGDATRLITVDPAGAGSVLAVADGRVLSAGKDLGLDVESWGFDYGGRSTAETVLGDTLYWWSRTTLTAYRVADLGRRWQADIPPTDRLVPCGRLVCALGRNVTTAVDPATGATRWAAPWRTITPGGVAVTVAGRVARLDPATGRVVAELGRGSPVGGLLLRFERDRTWVASLADGRIIGVLPLVFPTECEVSGPFLACPATGETVSVWRVE